MITALIEKTFILTHEKDHDGVQPGLVFFLCLKFIIMSYQKILTGEISSMIDELIEKQILINPNSVTSEICENHSDELLDDAPFSTFNNYSNVRREVRKVMSKKLDIDHLNIDSQLTIEGFKYVQKYYSIERNNDYVGVPVDQLTKTEIHEKADQLNKMGRACLRHSTELQKYYLKRKINV